MCDREGAEVEVDGKEEKYSSLLWFYFCVTKL